MAARCGAAVLCPAAALQGKADDQRQRQVRSTHAAQQMLQMPSTGGSDASPEVPSVHGLLLPDMTCCALGPGEQQHSLHVHCHGMHTAQTLTAAYFLL